MPCDQIRQTTVDFGKVDAARLADAMKARGWKISQLEKHSFIATKAGVEARFTNGQFDVESEYGRKTGLEGQELVEIRKEFQRQTLTYAAKRAGAVLKWTNAERTEGVMVKASLGFGFGSKS